MDRFLTDRGMRIAGLLLGLVAGLYGLAVVFYGDVLFPTIAPRATRLANYFYLVLPFLTLVGAALALRLPGPASLFLFVSAGGWLAMGVVLDYGLAITILPILLSIIAAGFAFAVAGPLEVVYSTDRINTWIGKLFALSVVVLTIAVCYEVFMRYVLRAPTRWGYDVGYMLYGAGFLMAGAYALSQAAHVRADVIYRFWPPRIQASVDLVLFLVFYFPAAFFFIYSGFFFAERSWAMREFSSASPFNIPVYHFKTLLPIAGVLLFMQGLAELLRCAICLRDGQWPPRLSDVEEIEKQAMVGRRPIVAGLAPQFDDDDDDEPTDTQMRQRQGPGQGPEQGPGQGSGGGER
jgi:TRAP-type mannitol/chloroaromatic compound transport system permease small subunit